MAASDKVSSGEAFRPPLAQTWNAMVDAGEAHRASRLSKTEGSLSRPRETDKIKCKNASGAARRRGEILGDFDNPLTNLEPDRLRLAGSLPTEGGHFGILLKATPDGEYEDLQVSGACIALVNIGDESHERAKFDGSTHVLESADEGPVEILYAPSGTGEQECFVRFMGQGGESQTNWILNTTSTITAAAGSTLGSGTAEVLRRNGSVLEVTGEVITVYNTQEESIASGSIVQAKNVDGDAYIDVERC